METKIKFEKKIFDLIKSGRKIYEFRKLEKGYTKGYYEAVDVNDTSKVFGRIKLNPLCINPDWEGGQGGRRVEISHNHWYDIDDETYRFVSDNYEMKDKDYVAYAVEVV